MRKNYSKFLNLSLILFVALAGCDKSSPGYTIIPAEPVSSVIQVDSTRFDKPEFGDANTVRQFPFGPAKVYTENLRLIATRVKGKNHELYFYDDKGRLTERRVYAGDRIHIGGSTRYFYHPNSAIKKIEHWINVIGLTPESFPTSDELMLYSFENYLSEYTDGAYDKVTQRAESRGSYYSPESLQLGFDKNGRRVWEGRTTDNVNYYQYWATYRAENGNIREIKYRNQYDYPIGYRINYTYDNQKNPIFTTGDPADAASQNLNNVLVARFTTNQGNSSVETFAYIYRPDGYPKYKMSAATKDTLIEYVYNK